MSDIIIEQKIETIDSVLLHIKKMANYYISLIDNHWKMDRAKDSMYNDGDYTEFDLFSAQKSYIREQSNIAEIQILSLTNEELQEYQFLLNLDNTPNLPVKLITVGAFVYRFTPAEYGTIKDKAQSNPIIDHALFTIQGRSYIDLCNIDTRKVLEAFKAFGVLGEIHEPKLFNNRVDELLQLGKPNEMYRG